MTDRLASFRAATFEPHTGTSFRLQAEVELVLVRVDSRPVQPDAPRPEPFTLVFTGPEGTALPQATYDLTHPDLGQFALFLVPIQPAADGLARYEAVFN